MKYKQGASVEGAILSRSVSQRGGFDPSFDGQTRRRVTVWLKKHRTIELASKDGGEEK